MDSFCGKTDKNRHISIKNVCILKCRTFYNKRTGKIDSCICEWKRKSDSFWGEWSHDLRLKFPFIYGAWLTISYAFTNAIFHSWKKSLVLVHAALCCTQHGTGFDEYMWSVSQRDETLLVSEWGASHHKITPSFPIVRELSWFHLYPEMELVIGGCFYCLFVALELNLHILVKNTIVEIILSKCF